MKQNWERTAPTAALTLEQVRELVHSAWGAIAHVRSAMLMNGGLSNTNYKIELAGEPEPLVLRIYRGDGAVCRKEADIARLVGGAVPVPAVLHADAGCTLLDKPWAIVRWAAGAPLAHTIASGRADDIAAAAEAAGESLARIHAFRFPAAGFFGAGLAIAEPVDMNPDLYLAFMEDYLLRGTAGRWLGAEAAEAAWAFCRKHAPLIGAVKMKPVLVHSDYNGLNVLVAGGAERIRVSAVLDWEFAFAESALVDIGNMLRYEEPKSLFERRFIGGYMRAGGELPDDWRLLSRMSDLISLCDMLNKSAANAPNRIGDLVRLIGRTVKEYA